jgi:hypothetical protein
VQSAGDLTVHDEELPILVAVLRTENIKTPRKICVHVGIPISEADETAG